MQTKLKKGDILICHKALKMQDTGHILVHRGDVREIVDVTEDDIVILTKDLHEREYSKHYLNKDSKSDSYYGIWFKLYVDYDKKEVDDFLDDYWA